jgi:lysophospholipid acyltransferase (LPLAT)-like uncharacterized protein
MKTTLVSNLIYWLVSLVASTMRLTLVGEEKIEETRARYGGVILVGWHGRSFLPITHYRGRGYWSFISTSRDGNIQNKLFVRCGFKTVRGSTSARGAVASALRMAKELRGGAVLAHTPDGPRGPIHVVHPGAIFLAEKSGCPIIPAGITAYPAWQLNTWDAYQVPKLFSRGTIVLGEPVHVPPKLSEAERDEFCRSIGDEICRLEAMADAMVRSVGTRCAAVETRSS